MNDFLGAIGVIGGILAVILIAGKPIAGILIILSAWPTMLLWNWLMPVIFNLPEIILMQSVGLLFLSWLLLKSNVNVKK